MSKKIKILIYLALLISSVFSVLKTQDIYAVSEDELYNKALLNVMEKCFTEKEMYSSVYGSYWKGFSSSVLKRGKKTSALFIPTKVGSGNDLGDQEKGTKVGCYELFLGDKPGTGTYAGTMSGVFEIYNIKVPDAQKVVSDNKKNNLRGFLERLGYSRTSDPAQELCYDIYYSGWEGTYTKDIKDAKAGSFCWPEGLLKKTSDRDELAGGADISIESNSRIRLNHATGLSCSYGGNGEYNLVFNIKDSSSPEIFCTDPDFNSLDNTFKNFVNGHAWASDTNKWDNENNQEIIEGYTLSVKNHYNAIDDDFGLYSFGSKDYHSGKYRNAYHHFRESIGKPTVENFSNLEKYSLYDYYLDKVYNVVINNGSCSAEKPSNVDSNGYNVYIIGKGWCNVAVNEAEKTKTVSGFKKDQSVYLDTYYNFDELIDAMNEIYNNLTFEELEELPEGQIEGTEKEDDNGEKVDTCLNSGGAGSLGWIVCPVMEWMANEAEYVYTEVLEPSLRIEPELFTKGGNSGAKQGWEIFRNMANVIFSIIFLVVIFSQLTGWGIDNYGIKKILPKLIIVAILINLSYFICTLCVDLSNIVGGSLKGLFDGLPANVPSNVPGGSGAGATIISASILVALVGGTFLAVYSNPAVVLPLLVGALGVLIAFLFLFVLLAGRQAAVLVLTVVSPLAFVCYILPSLKKTIFDKWLKLGQGLLLVYPICGLLVGGGNYTSRLLASTGMAGNSFFGALTVMLVGIVPIFFVPTVLKGAFAAMGSFGAKLAGFGEKMRGDTTKKISNLDGYKAAMDRGKIRKNRIKAGLGRDNKPTRIGAAKARFARTRFGKAIGYAGLQGSRIAAAKKAQAIDIEGDTALRNLQLERSNIENPNLDTETYLRGELAEAVANGNDDAIFAVIDQMRKSNMQASHIAQATRDILGSRPMSKNFLERFAKTYGGDFLKKDFEQLDWARKGGIVAGVGSVALGSRFQTNRNGVSHMIGGEWAAASNMAPDDMKDEDVAALSSDRLADFIRDGRITQAQAQRVWAANGNMDDTSRLMLGAYGNDGTRLTKQQAQAELVPGTRTMSAEQVAAYTEKAASNVVVEDVRLRDQSGQHRQTDRLGVEGEFKVKH